MVVERDGGEVGGCGTCLTCWEGTGGGKGSSVRSSTWWMKETPST